ncbi:PIN domain-containing protein [Ereboglobus luteus]|nr:PIN domain-containing protein [Ereboglobus luteus]
MNGIILDTSVVIAAEKGKLDLNGLLGRQQPCPIAIAAITLSELLHGVERADTTARGKARAAWLESFRATVTIIDFDEGCARVHAKLWAKLEAAGERIGAHDMLIAATALTHNMRVATCNAGEFKRVANLKVITP